MRPATLLLAILALPACGSDEPIPDGYYPLVSVNDSPVPVLYHATVNCDSRIESGSLTVSGANATLVLRSSMDCTRAGGANDISDWQFLSNTAAFADGAAAVVLVRAPSDTVRLMGAYAGGYLNLGTNDEVLPNLSGAFRFGPRTALSAQLARLLPN